MIEVGVLIFEVLFLFVSFFFVFLHVITFSFTFVFHAFDSSRFPLVYLVLLSLHASFWFILQLVDHLLCGSFIHLFARSCWFEHIHNFTLRLQFLSSGLMPFQFSLSTSFGPVLLSPLPLPLSFFIFSLVARINYAMF